jgi:hypothetical protein
VHGEVEPPLIGEQNLPQIIAALLASIKDAPHIAEKARPRWGAVLCSCAVRCAFLHTGR